MCSRIHPKIRPNQIVCMCNDGRSWPEKAKKTSRKNETTDITHTDPMWLMSRNARQKRKSKSFYFKTTRPSAKIEYEKGTARENTPAKLRWRRCAGVPDTIVIDPKIMSIKCRRLLAFYSSLLVKFSSPIEPCVISVITIIMWTRSIWTAFRLLLCLLFGRFCLENARFRMKRIAFFIAPFCFCVLFALRNLCRSIKSIGIVPDFVG